MTTSSDNKEQTENYKRLILSFPAKFFSDLNCMHCRSSSDSMLVQKVLETWIISPHSSSTQHNSNSEQNSSSTETHTTKHSNNELILHTPLVFEFMIQSVCKLLCVYYSMAVCISTTIFLIKRTICIYATDLFMEYCVKAAVYNFLLRFLENKGNVAPGSSKKFPPTGVDPPFPHRSQADFPLDHGSYDVEENAACCIRTPLISTSGCRLNSHSLPIHDVYTRHCYTLGESATPHHKHDTGPCSRNPSNLHSHVTDKHSARLNTDPPELLLAFASYEYDNTATKANRIRNYQHVITPAQLQPSHVDRIRVNKLGGKSYDTNFRIERLNSRVKVAIPSSLRNLSHCGSENYKFARAHLISFAYAIVLVTFSFALNLIHALARVRVVESEDDDKNSKSNQSNNVSTAGRNSSVAGRRPIRPLSDKNVNSSSNGDDGGDEDENLNQQKQKAQCENDETILFNIPEDDDDDNDLTSKPPARKPQSNSTHIYPGHSYMNIREMSFMKGISKVWDLAKNVSGYNSTQSNAPADLNVSVASLVGDIPDLPDVTLTFSPKATEVPRSGSRPSSPVYLTPPSNIPVSRLKTREFDSQITLDDISPIRSRPRNRVRSKSESSYRQDPYYIPTPSALLKRRLKERISLERTGIFDETPCNRRRHNSEPSASLSPSPESQRLNLSFSQGQIGCTRIRETGLFNCEPKGNGFIHLQNEFLESGKPFRLSKQHITIAIERALSCDIAKTEDSNAEATLVFCSDEVDRFTRLSTMDKHSKNLTEEKALLYLLGQMNRHMSKVTSCEQSFNGLKITGMADRSKRLQLADDDCYPLGLLHIGKNRGLNLTPKATPHGLVSLIDVDMRPWSFLTISAKTRSSMTPYFAPESRLESHAPDYHVIIEPCNSEGPCNFPPLLCRSCLNIEDVPEEPFNEKQSLKASSGTITTADSEAINSQIPTPIKVPVDNPAGEKKGIDDHATPSGILLNSVDQHASKFTIGNPDIDGGTSQNREDEVEHVDMGNSIPGKTDGLNRTSTMIDENALTSKNKNDEISKGNKILDNPAEAERNTNAGQGPEENRHDSATTEVDCANSNTTHADAVPNGATVLTNSVNHEEKSEAGNAQDHLAEVDENRDSSEEQVEISPNSSPTNAVAKEVVCANTTSVPPDEIQETVDTIDIAGDTNTTKSTVPSEENKNLVAGPKILNQETEPKPFDNQDEDSLTTEDDENTIPPKEISCLSFFTPLEGTGSGVFYSEAVCVNIVNVSASRVNLTKWLKQCGIKAHPKNSHINRAKVLAFIDAILDRKASPPEAFVTSFTTKLVAESLDNELRNFGISTKSKTSAIIKKKLLMEFILKSHKPGDAPYRDLDRTSHATAVDSRDDQPPPIISSDSSFSSSDEESDTDRDSTGSDLSYRPGTGNAEITPNRPNPGGTNPKSDLHQGQVAPKTPIQLVTYEKSEKTTSPKPIGNQATKQENDKNLKSKKSTTTKERESGPTVIELEGPLKTLENSLLKLEKRITDQELIIENLTRKPRESNPTSADVTQPQAKTLKSLEARTKILSDTLNVQQNSLDNLVDRLATCDKERKRNKEQIAQVNSVLCQHRKESKESLVKITSDTEALEHKCLAQCRDSLTSINTRVEQIAQENHKYDEMFSSIKDELSEVHQFMRNLNQEISSLKENLKHTQPHDSQCHDQSQLAREIQEMKAENRKFFETIIPLITSSDNSATRRRKTSEKPDDFPNGSRRSKHSQTDDGTPKTAEKTEKAQQNSAVNERRSHTNPKSHGKNQEMKTPTSGDTIQITPTPSHTQGKPDLSQSRENSQSQQETQPRVTYRRDTQSSNGNVSGNGSEPSRSGRTHSSSESLNCDDPRLTNVTIDGSDLQEESKTKRENYSTRKCMVIHDPYFKDFDKNKFSKWYDITTRKYETLLQTKRDPALLAEIQKLSPAVVFLHIGQADVLNRTPGNTVVADLTWIIKEILSKTSAKVCVSLMIPLDCIPQAKSVISQVNREVSKLITDLRQTKMGSSRIFTLNNDVLGDFITRTTSSNGTVVSLNNRGRRKLWLHLRDGLSRALDPHPRQTPRVTNPKKSVPSRTEAPGSRSNHG